MSSTLVFSEFSTDFSRTLASLKRSTLSIHNRLSSILDDAEFVCSVSDSFKLPLVANERCGGWYIPPERRAGSVYFKSTDGHTGQWSFNTRRLNLHILDVIGKHDGCIIVDSTRRGKSMPDALSKTVPIWCAVINRVLFPELKESHCLHLPPSAVSAAERSQISALLDRFVQQFKDIKLDLSSYRSNLSKPLRPLWFTRDLPLPPRPLSSPQLSNFHLVVLCTASRRVAGGEMSEGGYIQGAGDDSEAWSNGLTSVVFWKHRDSLMGKSDNSLAEIISKLMKEEQSVAIPPQLTKLAPTTKLFIGQTAALLKVDTLSGSDVVVSSSDSPDDVLSLKLKSRYIHLKCRQKKLGSRDLRAELSKVHPLRTLLTNTERIIVTCPDGKDICVGVALAILCLFVDDHGNMETKICQDESKLMTKQFIRRRLGWIVTSMPSASPSRATLQSVNDFLFSCSTPETHTAKPSTTNGFGD